MFYEHIIRAAGHAGETRLTRFSHIENGIVLNMKNEITKAAESDTVYVRFNECFILRHRAPYRTEGWHALCQ